MENIRVKNHAYYLDNIENNFVNGSWSELIIGLQIHFTRIYYAQTKNYVGPDATNFHIDQGLFKINEVLTHIADLSKEDLIKVYQILKWMNIPSVNIFTADMTLELREQLRDLARLTKYEVMNRN